MQETSSTTRRRNAAIGLGVIAFAAAMRLYGIGWGLPEVYEEAVPLKRAWAMWGWGTGNGLDLNPHFFTYPSLIIYVQFLVQGILYLVMKLFGVVGSTLDHCAIYLSRPTPMYLAGRLVTMGFGVGAVWMTFLLGRKAGGYTAAIPAAVLLSVNTAHLSKSQAVEVDVPLTFFVVLFLWLAVRLTETPTEKNYLLAGAAVGLAASTK